MNSFNPVEICLLVDVLNTMEQPAGRKRRAGGRSAVNRIPEETVVHKDSRWDIQRKSALLGLMGRIVRHLVVTFRKATQIGL